VPNPVSWQSAFWAVLATVINVLIQDAGSVAGLHKLPAVVNVGLRSSPIVCVMDSAFLCFNVGYLVVQGFSWQNAISISWLYRFDTRKDRVRIQGWKMDKLWWINAAAFVLSLVQTIKIFVMSGEGILITKLLAATYLGAFIIPEIVRVLAVKVTPIEFSTLNDGHNDYLQSMEPSRTYVVFFSILLQLAIRGYMISTLGSNNIFIDRSADATSSIGAKTELFELFTILLILSTPVLTMLVYGILLIGILAFWEYVYERSSRLSKLTQRLETLAVFYLEPFTPYSRTYSILKILYVAAGFLVFGIALSWPIIFVTLQTATHPEYFVSLFKFTLAICILLGVMLCLLLVCVAGEIWLGLDSPDWTITGLIFFTFNFVSLIIYYRSIFDSTATYKPPWAEMFG
jgi:hypothetical protein